MYPPPLALCRYKTAIDVIVPVPQDQREYRFRLLLDWLTNTEIPVFAWKKKSWIRLVPVHVQSLPYVSNAVPNAYLDGWTLRNTRFCKLRFARGIMHIESEFLIGESSSNFSSVRLSVI